MKTIDIVTTENKLLKAFEELLLELSYQREGLIVGGLIVYKVTKHEVDPDDAARHYQWDDDDGDDDGDENI